MAGTSRKKKRYLNRILILSAVFVIAFVGYFAWTLLNTERVFTEYTSMEEPTLPVVYPYVYGEAVNVMHGYVQDLGNEAAGDSITILPQNRRLEIRIKTYHNAVANLSYEIRSLDLSHFIENTSVDTFQTDGDEIQATLPIQNMIEKDQQYLLTIHLDTGERTVHYYTRILWTDGDEAYQMLQFAEDFARKTFDYDAARELATYLETNEQADQSTLGTVKIDSGFSQLTWAGTGMELATDIEATLKEFDGIMGAVELHYMTSRKDALGNEERYQVRDVYTVRTGTDRMYLMDYVRKTDQLFDGGKQLFSGKRITLGITNDEMLQAEKSENAQYLAFTADRELWMYDQKRKCAVNVFSFRSGQDDGVRANYDQHAIRILSVENNGDLDFAVYGYMNRGRHEGYNGIACYRYSRAEDTITEIFFIPLAKTYEKIRLELSELFQKGANDMLYLKQNDSIVAIDLRSLEMLEIASGLTDGSYAISVDQSRVAWQDGPVYDSAQIKFMDLTDGSTKTIAAGDGEALRVLGFMDQDLLYGVARKGDEWILSNCVKGLPVFRLEIVSETLETRKQYEKSGSYIDHVEIAGNRIHLNLVRKNDMADPNHAYVDGGTDTIIYQDALQDSTLNYIGSYQSEDRERLYYVALDQEIKTTRNLRISVPAKLSYENAGTIGLAKEKPAEGMRFYAYASGNLVGKTARFDQAVSLCYDGMGWVTDENHEILYNRTDRDAYAEIRYPTEWLSAFQAHLSEFTESTRYEDGWTLLNGQGMNLTQALYYADHGMPVALYLEDMQYVLIAGYDNFNVRFYDPFAGEGSSFLLGRADAEAYITEHQNDFVCGIRPGA